jgi:hypothetical protein
MPNFAVLDGESVIDLIVADSKDIAESLTNKNCVEYTTTKAQIGGTYVNGHFVEKKPYPSWVLDENYEWQSPSPYPIPDLENPKAYKWNEDNLEWVVDQD